MIVAPFLATVYIPYLNGGRHSHSGPIPAFFKRPEASFARSTSRTGHIDANFNHGPPAEVVINKGEDRASWIVHLKH